MGLRNHLWKRVSDALGNEINLSKFQISYSINDSYVDLNLSHADLGPNISSLLEMKTDNIIRKISTKSDVLKFSVERDIFVKDVLNNQTTSQRKTKQIIVEFSSPNIAKPFHMGHLRSTIVGNFIANILSISYNVKKLNYLGDWGAQVGYVLAGLDSIQSKEFNNNPIETMYNAYVKAYGDPSVAAQAREIFERLEIDNSIDAKNDWDKVRKATVANLTHTYETLGVTFDEYSFESDYKASSITWLIDLLKEKNIATVKDNALVARNADLPLLRGNQTTLYLMRDIAAALDRLKKFKCDKILYVVDKSQSDHFGHLKNIISEITNQNIIEHVPFGRIIGMSTRKGTSVFLHDILKVVTEKMYEQQQKSPNTRANDLETTQLLGLSALNIFILRQRRYKDFKFDWDLAIQSTGDTGVKLQYTHARLTSLENTQGFETVVCDPSLLQEPIVLELIVLLARYNHKYSLRKFDFRYDDVITEAQNSLESSILVNYLFEVCNLCSKCLKVLPIKNESKDLGRQRLLLFHTTKEIIARTMNILGLKPLNKM